MDAFLSSMKYFGRTITFISFGDVNFNKEKEKVNNGFSCRGVTTVSLLLKNKLNGKEAMPSFARPCILVFLEDTTFEKV